MWDAQAEHLEGRFMVLRYDIRGHGASRGASGFRIEDLAEDLDFLMDRCSIARAHVVGLSLGGLIAQAFAERRPERVDRLVLADTTCIYPEQSHPLWRERMRLAREVGMEALVGPTLERWFTDEFRQAEAAEVERVATMLRGTQVDGYLGCCEALMGADLRDAAAKLQSPTLVMVGERDSATPPSMANDLHRRIEGSQIAVIPKAAHLSNIEGSAHFNRVLDEFLVDSRSARAGILWSSAP
jgi:3-oxoadipate enol-lactonase